MLLRKRKQYTLHWQYYAVPIVITLHQQKLSDLTHMRQKFAQDVFRLSNNNWVIVKDLIHINGLGT